MHQTLEIPDRGYFMTGDIVKKESRFKAGMGGLLAGAAIAVWCVTPILPLANSALLALAGVLLSVGVLAKYEIAVNGDTSSKARRASKLFFPSYLLLVLVIGDAVVSSVEKSFECEELQRQMLDKQQGSAIADKAKAAAHDPFSALGCQYQARYLSKSLWAAGLHVWPGKPS